MSRDIPFFEMFTELQLSGELRLRLAGAVVNGACIDQAGMSLALRLTTRAELGDAELEELKHPPTGDDGSHLQGSFFPGRSRREPPGCFGPGGPLRQ